ncbi:phage antirepressor KilAC domain-containing protein [Ligilactobacillus ruminis]|uniref:Prophage antirepressor n=1 Tax=Ligilactobacillus ruminis (strain ATCC 27782 / RF3) TaxID=1069534 RepID=G2SN26_LIGR2|nr:phage antirepressor [Ligilactobacillus ruminis]AEN78000.1 Prophage antirepressor [Ligilactobacillus ruminis ATCC 27782]
MNELKNFSFEGRQIRALTIEEKPYFVGKDVVDILGYRNGSRDINRHVDEEDRRKAMIFDGNQDKETIIINESGLYSLILSSKLPDAKKFKHWVTSEVLPTIRKHGAYMTDQKAVAIVTDKNALADLLQQAADQLKEKDVKIERLTAELEVSNKKATYLDLIVETKDGMTATQVAQDYGLSAKKFNALLNALGVQRKVNEQWILYAKYQGKGYIASKTFTYTDSTGKNHAKINTVWTQKGRLFLYELLKANGILPLIEREDIA